MELYILFCNLLNHHETVSICIQMWVPDEYINGPVRQLTRRAGGSSTVVILYLISGDLHYCFSLR